MGFDFAPAFDLPVRVVNDAAMQALGSYEGGKMLFLGLGTGLGSTMIVNGIVEPMELGHLPYKKGTCEDYVGNQGLDRVGKKRWRKLVKDVLERLVTALEPEDVVIGGGSIIHLKKLPRGCRAGNNAHAFIGGFLARHDVPDLPVLADDERRPRRESLVLEIDAVLARTRPPWGGSRRGADR